MFSFKHELVIFHKCNGAGVDVAIAKLVFTINIITGFVGPFLN